MTSLPFSSAVKVHEYTKLVNQAVKSLVEADPSGPLDRAKVHEVINDHVNFSYQEVLHQSKKFAGKPDYKKLLGGLSESLTLLGSVTKRLGEDFNDNTLVNHGEYFREQALELLGAKVAEPHKEEAPPLEEMQVMSDSDDDDTFIKVTSRASKRLKKRGPHKVETKIRLVPDDPTVGSIDLGDVTEIESETSGGPAVFKVTARLLPLFYQPGRTLPTVGGQVIKFTDIKNFSKEQIEWKEITQPCFIPVMPLSNPVLMAALKEGMISEVTYKSLLNKVTADDRHTIVELTKDEAVAKFGAFAVRTAVIEYYKAQSIKLMERYGGKAKTPFVTLWFDRLIDVPEPLDGTAPAHVFFHMIKKACLSDSVLKELNRTFFSFKIANLAVWRKGQTREEMIEKSKKSLLCYWGRQADTYIRLFKTTEEGQLLVKPKSGALFHRLQKTAAETARRAKAEALSFKNATASYAQVAAADIKAKDEEIAALAPDLPWYERWSIVFKQKWNRANGLTHGPDGEPVCTACGSTEKHSTRKCHAKAIGHRLKMIGYHIGGAVLHLGIDALFQVRKASDVTEELGDLEIEVGDNIVKPRIGVRFLVWAGIYTAAGAVKVKNACKSLTVSARNAIRSLGRLFYDEQLLIEKPDGSFEKLPSNDG